MKHLGRWETPPQILRCDQNDFCNDVWIQHTSGTPKGASGFTLVEVLIAVGVFTTIAALVSSGVFQVLSLQRSWQDNAMATKDWRHSESWFARDALNAQTTDLADGAPPAGSVTLAWVDSSNEAHTAAYSLSGSSLERDLDGVTIEVARRVVSAEFSRSGKVVTLRLEVRAKADTTEVTTLQTYLRMLQ
ncbi:MAG: prepilin-type N-terminal cleavage/methylation domain-containing protein [Chloroflexi bacterium]|nr:prepilin-type N-terminal cleavage/methylation domain-containing protein [Chloroflexota bacterium]